jgi:hypothetical protein
MGRSISLVIWSLPGAFLDGSSVRMELSRAKMVEKGGLDEVYGVVT